MKKKLFTIVVILTLVLSLTACGTVPPVESEMPVAEPQSNEAETEEQRANTMTAYRADGSAVILEFFDDGVWKDENELLYYLGEDGVLRARGAENLYTEVPSAVEPEIVRQDGERFEAVIMLEGMEEAVRYEHVKNEALGFEMDYEYESLVRHREPDRERFISIWDDPDNPQNYLEVTRNAEGADTVAASVRETLSQEYELHEESRELNRAGSCIYIEASEVKGTGSMADQLQAVYIIPASDGCFVATAHFSVEAAEGFGRRFNYMVHTLAVSERSEPAAEAVRQDGERFEGTITLEGMEQTVRYEHIVNKTAGFEMDYDYETFVRHSEEDRERFVLAWDDDPANPEYYLEVTYSTQDAETVAAAIGEELSKDYEITRGSMELDRAGSCIRIGASEVKGGGYTADRMQMVYIIPTDVGCRIATAHYGADSSDLFGARFRAMVNTLSVIDR